MGDSRLEKRRPRFALLRLRQGRLAKEGGTAAFLATRAVCRIALRYHLPSAFSGKAKPGGSLRQQLGGGE